jgi:DNA-binding NtrC family response regulator
MFSILIIEDEVTYARALGRSLEKKGLRVCLEATASSGLERARREKFDVILLDNRLPDILGLNIIGRLLAIHPLTSIIMMTAYGTVEDAVDAMRQGAEDYVVKSTSPVTIVDRVLEIRERNLKREKTGNGRHWSAEELLGECDGLRVVRQQIEEVSRSAETTVLLTGESGTGKEVAARSLHVGSGKPRELFTPVDCLSLPSGLAESHLFGHEKGSFTGADRTHAGFFEVAQDGTVFLDEIGDIEVAMQGKLLRTLETRVFRRIGGTHHLTLQARVVLATNRELSDMVRKGTFREDLYHRISVFPIHLPPLRERGDDVLLLADHFIRFFSERLHRNITGLDEEAQLFLLHYEYPGNVRELKNIIERAVILAKGDRIVPELLPERVVTSSPARSFSDLKQQLGIEFVPGVDTIDSVERRMIHKALELSDGVKSRAADMLGISRFQLLRRLEKYAQSEQDPTRNDPPQARPHQSNAGSSDRSERK